MKHSLKINIKFCPDCLKNLDKIKHKCFKCPREFVLKDIQIESIDNTLNEIIYKNKSISRFGDGEMDLIFGIGIGFQNIDKNLIERLLEVLNSTEKNLLIGIYVPYTKKELYSYQKEIYNYISKWVDDNKFNLLRILNKNKKYYSSIITRFYNIYKEKIRTLDIIKKWKKIWNDRNIIIIEGEKTRAGIGNDLFNNAKSIKRIICPSVNAYKLYDKILKQALKVSKNNLILIALGPTATILSYDLYKFGYQVIDIGHIDIEYELFLRNASKVVPIPNKYVNEARKGNINIGNIKDENYYSQIIEIILS